jgi:hypothetical protein
MAFFTGTGEKAMRQPGGDSDKVTITINEAVRRYGCCRDFWDRAISRGQLSKIKLSPRKVLLRVTEIEALLDKNTRPATTGVNAAT